MAKGDIKRRREIERLSASLPPMTPAQEWEAQQVCGTAWLGARKGWCDVCGREFDHDLWSSRKKHTACPHCGTRLQVKKSPNKRKESTHYYFHIITTVEGWQVVRTFFCSRSSTRADWFGNEVLNPSDVQMGCTEVFQKFIKPDTVPMIIGLGLRGLHYYSDLWKWDSGWKIRNDRYSAYGVWGWNSRKQGLLPELRMKGLKRLSDDSSPYEQIMAVFNEYRAEVLLKAGAICIYDAFVGRDKYEVIKHWDSIRVALRHRYKVCDAKMYLDFLDMLRANGKDMRNPHYICPKNLRAAHDEQMAVRVRMEEKAAAERARREAERLAEKLNEDGKTNREYVKKMGALLGVTVKDRDIEMRPLQNIRDFFEEGSMLHHCVFTNRYYQHHDCLVIGVRVKGVRTETIEVDTKGWKVVQCRGKHNQPSPYHDRILSLINDNINKFRNAINQ